MEAGFTMGRLWADSLRSRRWLLTASSLTAFQPPAFQLPVSSPPASSLTHWKQSISVQEPTC